MFGLPSKKEIFDEMRKMLEELIPKIPPCEVPKEDAKGSGSANKVAFVEEPLMQADLIASTTMEMEPDPAMGLIFEYTDAGTA